jgi:hypothetical protein
MSLSSNMGLLLFVRGKERADRIECLPAWLGLLSRWSKGQLVIKRPLLALVGLRLDLAELVSLVVGLARQLLDLVAGAVRAVKFAFVASQWPAAAWAVHG